MIQLRQRQTFTIDIQLFAGEKTEPATPKRRQESRKKGQVARSSEVGRALTLLAGFLALPALGGYAFIRTLDLMESLLGQGLVSGNSPRDFEVLMKDVLLYSATAAAPLALVCLAAELVASFAQVGFNITAEPLLPRMERINPVSGLKRILSKRAFVELVKSLIKVTVVGYLAYGAIKSNLAEFPDLVSVTTVEAAARVGDIVYGLGLKIGIALLVLAVFDYAYQRWEFEESIKMSKQEIKDELKQTEGDPLIRSRIRRLQREMASRRMMQRVPEADVVITNPTHIAVALSYKPGEMEAPLVVAKGAGVVAQKIKEIARQNNVKVVENPPLARALYDACRIDQQIPPELYKAVAEVLAMVYRLKKRRKA